MPRRGLATLVLLVCALCAAGLLGVRSAQLHRSPPPRRASSPPKGRTPSGPGVRTQTPSAPQPPSPTPPAPPPPVPRAAPPPAPPPNYGPKYDFNAQTSAVRFYTNLDEFGVRIDIAVPNPAAPTQRVWAPWCYSKALAEQRAFAGSIVTLLCKQALPRSGGGFVVSDLSFPIPQGPVPSGQGYLNPAEYKAWVSIPDEKVPGDQVTYNKTTLDLSIFKVSTTPCESGALLVGQCVFFGR
ncbi:hypothetical protein HYH02_008555 [Chlamydomonas schloesseri]|uniref:Uncharacterized protein n=1 Tax=Chlamydomonas schloesseri TaxID=2026947 RepID=A0A835WFV9_9CHLO|nr:hypothetical protein HYH02_008555 [Chlamydomonas schloesseri]|eukprot:KAG2446568.1 hypothetical protein HYH02_008555 [Chlamydomonas schloesseri]